MSGQLKMSGILRLAVRVREAAKKFIFSGHLKKKKLFRGFPNDGSKIILLMFSRRDNNFV